jgi:hypothetical protein
VYAYDYVAGTGQPMDATDTIDRQISGDAMYLVLAPIGPSGMAVLGDTNQFVTLGKKRVPSVEDNGTIRVTVAFAGGETSRTITGFSPWQPAAHALFGAVSKLTYDAKTQRFQVTVTPSANGTATFRIVRSVGRPMKHHPTQPAAQ